MKKLVLIAVVASALLTAFGCNGHGSTDHSDKHDRLETTTGGRLP